MRLHFRKGISMLSGLAYLYLVYIWQIAVIKEFFAFVSATELAIELYFLAGYFIISKTSNKS